MIQFQVNYGALPTSFCAGADEEHRPGWQPSVNLLGATTYEGKRIKALDLWSEKLHLRSNVIKSKS